MRAELRRVKPDTCDSLLNEARVLSGRQAALVAASGEQELSWFAPGQSKVVIECLTRLIGHLKSHRPAGLLLSYGCAIRRVSTWRRVIGQVSAV